MTLLTYKYLFMAVMLILSSVIVTAQTEHESRLTFGYTAKPIQKGHGYINTYNGLIYQAEIGVTNNFSIGAGTSAFTFLKNYDNIFGIRAKLAFSVNEKIHLGVGSLLMPRFDDNTFTKSFSTITSMLMTIDISDSQLTFGTGFTNQVSAAVPKTAIRPIFNLGIIQPVFKKGFIISENWITLFSNNKIDSGFSLFSGWAYRFNKKRISLDLGFLTYILKDGDGGVFRILPQASFSYHF